MGLEMAVSHFAPGDVIELYEHCKLSGRKQMLTALICHMLVRAVLFWHQVRDY